MSSVPDDERVLILAPTGRDAALAHTALTEAGLAACICPNVELLCREMEAGAGVALIAQEALTVSALRRLTETVAAQSPWSDLPLVILTSGKPASDRRIESLDTLGNATLLERPLRVVTLISMIRGALAARRRQYELREHLRERERLEQALLAEYEKQHHIAETLQRSLLSPPALGAFPNLAVASLYQAARSEADIGGDFFDAFALNGERVALVVGDVSGKGLEAASRTAEVKYALRAFLREDASPAGALDRANDFLLDTQMLDGQSLSSFVCVALGVLEAETGVLHIAGAGAEAPLLLRADGGAEAVAGNGPPLGVTAMAEYTEQLVHLSAGDTVLFVTDGVTEARRGREFFGYEGFVETAQRVGARESLESLGQAIIGDASDFAGGKLGDDVCLLLARYDPPPASSP